MDGDGYVLPMEQRPAHQEALGCPQAEPHMAEISPGWLSAPKHKAWILEVAAKGKK